MLEADDLIRWLIDVQTQQEKIIAEAYWFGSSLLGPSFSDVDIALVFNRWHVRDHLKSLKSDFEIEFNHRLHLQIFHVSQQHEIEKFLGVAGSIMRLI